MASKVVIIGSTNGHFAEAFAKVSAQHAKHCFSFALVIGDLFGEPSSTSPTSEEDIQRLLRGEIAVPFPTYFTLGKYPLPPAVQERVSEFSSEVCENLFFLGKKSTLTTSDGIRIVVLGGRLDPNLTGVSKTNSEEANAAPFFSAEDASALKGANSADLLITYEWPEGVANNPASDSANNSANSSAEMLEEDERTKGVRAVAELAIALRPRYHLVPGGELFWERKPYRNGLKSKENLNDVKITRFLGIADWGNSKKAKAWYAFNINVKEANAVMPLNVTSLPYNFEIVKRKRGREEVDESGNFFWAEKVKDSHDEYHASKRRRGRGRGGRDRGSRPPPGPESCFFCLSNPNVEKHLIVSIGNEAYLTIAKGPLTRASTNPPKLPFSSHILIIPISHSPTISSIDDVDTRSSTMVEMTNYRLAIDHMLKSRDCGAVSFEVSRAGGVHFHWQIIPVPEAKLAEVENAFQTAAEKDGLGTFEKREVEEGERDYFRIWISGVDGTFVLKLKPGDYFDLQFGRRVLAKLMGLWNVHWRDSLQTHEEEEKDANAFKEAFEPFDFNT